MSVMNEWMNKLSVISDKRQKRRRTIQEEQFRKKKPIKIRYRIALQDLSRQSSSNVTFDNHFEGGCVKSKSIFCHHFICSCILSSYRSDLERRCTFPDLNTDSWTVLKFGVANKPGHIRTRISTNVHFKRNSCSDLQRQITSKNLVTDDLWSCKKHKTTEFKFENYQDLYILETRSQKWDQYIKKPFSKSGNCLDAKEVFILTLALALVNLF